MKKLFSTFSIILTLSFLTACVSHSDNHKAEYKKYDRKTMKKKMIKAKESDKTLEVAKAFLEAAGTGDSETLNRLMADDFVWHNEGDSNIPWIGNWEGRETVLTEFMPKFGSGLSVTSWATDYSFANGNQAVFMGTMSAIANNTGIDTGKFSWAVRVHVEYGKVKRWSWFEDSFAVSKAYNANK